ncbi:hypothetical protein EW146_g8003 [Bondarzewia mesenterica]|uniref:Mid2 domain-containing protein n=1 Tax=Bondarzewia mesenterica TaxID=1095465 RepID=A0A4S4LHS5_9AGAM|nr:hypothetical protein EW146_g8003 [Bondarzewia mesenterica]
MSHSRRFPAVRARRPSQRVHQFRSSLDDRGPGYLPVARRDDATSDDADPSVSVSVIHTVVGTEAIVTTVKASNLLGFPVRTTILLPITEEVTVVVPASPTVATTSSTASLTSQSQSTLSTSAAASSPSTSGTPSSTSSQSAVSSQTSAVISSTITSVPSAISSSSSIVPSFSAAGTASGGTSNIGQTPNMGDTSGALKKSSGVPAAAIAVPVVVVILALLGLAFYLFRRRRIQYRQFRRHTWAVGISSDDFTNVEKGGKIPATQAITPFTLGAPGTSDTASTTFRQPGGDPNAIHQVVRKAPPPLNAGTLAPPAPSYNNPPGPASNLGFRFPLSPARTTPVSPLTPIMPEMAAGGTPDDRARHVHHIVA